MATTSTQQVQLQEGGLFAKRGGASIPLRSVSVNSFVKRCLVGTEAELVYSNGSSDPVEVVFRLPLDADTAVKGLRAEIAGKTIAAKVKRQTCEKYHEKVT